jgi:hypothetical protein
MKLHISWVLVLTAMSGLLLPANLAAEDKKKPDAEKKKEPAANVVIEGELSQVDLKDTKGSQSYCKTFTHKMEKDKTYQIDLSSTNFQPFLRLEDAKGTQVETGVGQPASIFYKAAKTEEYLVVVTGQAQGSIGKFKLTIRDAASTLVFSVTEKLTPKDEAYQGRKHKLFLVEMEAGKTYQIDMRSSNFDSYLFFESPNKKLLAQDDDSGGFPHARIIHKATETGKHRIIATHYSNGGTLGEFTVTVRQTDGPTAPAQDKKDK